MIMMYNNKQVHEEGIKKSLLSYYSFNILIKFNGLLERAQMNR